MSREENITERQNAHISVLHETHDTYKRANCDE